jgi:hypothetical protein
LPSGAALGVLWRLLLPGAAGLFSIFVALFIGYAVASAVSWATNRKVGPVLQLVAGAGVVTAYVTRNLLLGDAAIPSNDFWGYVVVGAGVVVAINRLRF